jgi:trigger factor
MQVSVEATGKLERTMKVRVPADEIEKEVAQRLKRVASTAKIKGFRPGKIPAKVVASRYGGQVRQEVLSEMLQRSYQQAIQQESLAPAGGPRIEPDEVAEGQDFSYTAVFEVFPEIELRQVEGLEIERPQVEISDGDVEEMIQRLRVQNCTWEELDRAAEHGHRVVVDFTGVIDGKPFEGGDGEDVPVVIGEGAMLDDFERALEGVAAGEKKTVQVRFPEDYRNSELAGREAELRVEVKRVERQVLPEVDEEFATRFGIEDGSTDTLRAEVRENMDRELRERIRNQLKRTMLERLREANPVELPEALVQQEVRALMQESMRRLGVNDPKQLPPPEAYMDSARRRVSVGLVLNEVVRQQGIKVDPARVAARIEEVAAGYENPQEIIQLYRNQQGLRNEVEIAVLEEQVAEWLIERGKVTERQASFHEFMDD